MFEQNLLSLQPVDHKNLIYSCLTVSELKNLGFICWKLYKDEIRRKWLLQRVVDGYFYTNFNSRCCSLGPIKFESWFDFLKFFNKNDFLDLYLYRLQNIKMSNDLSQDGKWIRINNNGVISFQDNDNLYISGLERIEFSKLEPEIQKRIIMNVINYLYDIWKDAEAKNQKIYQYSSGYVFRSLHLCMLKFLQDIFINCKEIRFFLFDSLLDLQNRTKLKDDNTDDHNQFPESLYLSKYGSFTNQFNIHMFFEYIDYGSFTNQFNIHMFFEYIDECFFNNLDRILDIGSFLSELNQESVLYFYFYERFSSFIELGDKDEAELNDPLVEDFVNNLNKPYDEIQTKKQKLLQLFTLCNYNIHTEFENACVYRCKRARGEIEEDWDEDSDREDDDYDY